MNNTVQRSIFGFIFVVIMVGCMLLGNITNGYTYGALMLCVVVASLIEFYRITLHGHYKGSQILAILAGVCIFTGVFLIRAFHFPAKYLLVVFIPLFIIFCNALYSKDDRSQKEYRIVDFGAYSFFFTSILYIVVPFSIFNFIVFDSEGTFDCYPLLCLFSLVWAGDLGGYCFGLTLGKIFKKKLFVEISPKKSWAGFWGGLALAILTSWLLSHYGVFEIFDKVIPWYHAIGIAIVVNVAGVYGDLIESQWKRFYNVKDSGHAIPGHGGILDRFDSSMMAIPMGLVYLLIFGYV